MSETKMQQPTSDAGCKACKSCQCCSNFNLISDRRIFGLRFLDLSYPHTYALLGLGSPLVVIVAAVLSPIAMLAGLVCLIQLIICMLQLCHKTYGCKRCVWCLHQLNYCGCPCCAAKEGDEDPWKRPRHKDPRVWVIFMVSAPVWVLIAACLTPMAMVLGFLAAVLAVLRLAGLGKYLSMPSEEKKKEEAKSQ